MGFEVVANFWPLVSPYVPYLPLALALVVIVLWRISAGSRSTQRKAIAEALRMPDLELSDVPDEIRRIEVLMATMNADLKSARNDLRNASTSQAPPPPAAVLQRTAAIVLCCEDAIRKADILLEDGDFQRVERSMSLIVGLRNCVRVLKDISREAGFRGRLIDGLESSDFNVVLTAPDFFTAYFPDVEEWQSFVLQLKAGKAGLEALLDNQGARLIPSLVMEVVNVRDIQGSVEQDSREIRRIPAVQERAARKARELGEGEVLVTDCHKPGWHTRDKGTRMPLVVIFDPSTWT